MDTNESVKFFVKLPAWFTIDTPIGTYNPDWAIMMDDGRSLYMVRETKGTQAELELRPSEKGKIDAARKHFEAIDVDYQVARTFSDVAGYFSRYVNSAD